jgi:uncharacterized protein (DUF924 family)
LPPDLRRVLSFWFGDPDATDYGLPRACWWEKDAVFDGALRARFERVHEDALAGRHDAHLADPDGALAIVVALDQFPRNMYRGDARMYRADERARTAARRAVGQGHHQHLLAVERWFVVLPFEHSEHGADQDESVRLFGELQWHEPTKLSIESADRHREIVQLFGRFPHRNAILGRTTTAEEAAFLLQPNSSF